MAQNGVLMDPPMLPPTYAWIIRPEDLQLENDAHLGGRIAQGHWRNSLVIVKVLSKQAEANDLMTALQNTKAVAPEGHTALEERLKEPLLPSGQDAVLLEYSGVDVILQEYSAQEHPQPTSTPGVDNTGVTEISTFVIYSPRSAASDFVQKSKDGDITALFPEDLETLQTAFSDGGEIVSVHKPDIADGWVLKAAKVLSDISKFIVMIRPTKDNPLLKWTPGDHRDTSVNIQPPEAVEEDSDCPGIDTPENIEEGNDDASEDDTPSIQSGENTESTTSAPIHNVDVRLDIQPATGISYQVELLTKIQFKIQPEFEDKD
ncbi:hypothetical protein DFH07DRAFT_777660 [Mycena maculata]|uniref:Uncharacterized protein n=1 Tax=Mycena maculata TaxID=230809 RepID=A0AAD7N3E2_9AGAR|nr:hypothetical protein DFH07DRAFT_777660 [Mycena maculata]